MHNQLYSKQETYSRYLISLLRNYKYKQFLNALKGENIYDAIYLAQELAKDEEVFTRHYCAYPYDIQTEIIDLFAEWANSFEETRKGYARFTFAYWKYKTEYGADIKYIKYLISHKKIQDIINELASYVSSSVYGYFSYKASLAEILSELTEKAIKEQETFDYNAFFENHPRLFEIILQLPEEQQQEIFRFIFGFVMQLTSSDASISEYEKDSKFASDFITFLLKTHRKEVLKLFLEWWRFRLLGHFYYNKVMRLAFTEVFTRIMQDENLLRKYVELESDTRKFFIRVFLDTTGLFEESEKIAMKLLQKGYYEAFYDVFVLSDKTSIMKKIATRKTHRKAFLKLSFEEQKKIIDTYIDIVVNEAKQKDITVYNIFTASMLAEGQEELFWYLLTNDKIQKNTKHNLGFLGKYLAINPQALDVFEKMNETEQKTLIDFLAENNQELYEMFRGANIKTMRNTNYYAYYRFAFALARRGNIDLFIEMIEKQPEPLREEEYNEIFLDDFESLLKELLKQHNMLALNKLIKALNTHKVFKYVKEYSFIKNLVNEITVLLNKVNQSIDKQEDAIFKL